MQVVDTIVDLYRACTVHVPHVPTYSAACEYLCMYVCMYVRTDIPSMHWIAAPSLLRSLAGIHLKTFSRSPAVAGKRKGLGQKKHQVTKSPKNDPSRAGKFGRRSNGDFSLLFFLLLLPSLSLCGHTWSGEKQMRHGNHSAEEARPIICVMFHVYLAVLPCYEPSEMYWAQKLTQTIVWPP